MVLNGDYFAEYTDNDGRGIKPWVFQVAPDEKTAVPDCPDELLPSPPPPLIVLDHPITRIPVLAV